MLAPELVLVEEELSEVVELVVTKLLCEFALALAEVMEEEVDTVWVAEDEVENVEVDLEVVVAKCSDFSESADATDVSLYGFLTDLATHQLKRPGPTHRSDLLSQHHAGRKMTCQQSSH